MRVLRTDEKLTALPKPTLERVDRFSLGTKDCLIVCAGFEDRALSVLKNAVAGSSDFTVVIIDYLPFIPENRTKEIRTLCKQSGLTTIEVIYDRQCPAGFGDLLLESVSGCGRRVFLDISGMSRLLIVQAIVAMGRRDAGFKECVIAYSEAKTYPPSQNEAEAAIAKSVLAPTYSVLFLSSGVFEVTVIPELSSTVFPMGPTRLIAFPSLDAYQLTALRAELQPSRFTFIHGNPPSPENAWRPDAIRRMNRLDGIPHEAQSASTLDYRETLDGLLRLYGMHSERERLLISPTGSKMQAVAVGLFRSFIDDVQIVYPTPKEFRSPTNYTKDVRQLYSLPLSEFASVIA